jgi:hypothetical protein
MAAAEVLCGEEGPLPEAGCRVLLQWVLGVLKVNGGIRIQFFCDVIIGQACRRHDGTIVIGFVAIVIVITVPLRHPPCHHHHHHHRGLTRQGGAGDEVLSSATLWKACRVAISPRPTPTGIESAGQHLSGCRMPVTVYPL